MEQYIQLGVMAVTGIVVFIVSRKIGGFTRMIGNIALGIVAYCISLKIIDVYLPNLRVMSEVYPAVISFLIASITTAIPTFFDKESDLYYKSLKKQ